MQKIKRKESKQSTKDSNETTMEEIKRRRKERNRELLKQPENCEQNGNKYAPINNYFKYKWTK